MGSFVSLKKYAFALGASTHEKGRSDMVFIVLLILAVGTGGRWHDSCIRFVRDLARYRASSEPAVLRRSMQLAYQRRWWSLLSIALHDAITAALDPSLDVVAGSFP